MSSGWIKLWRRTQRSDMYRSLTSKQRDVMIQCLLLASHNGNTWEWGGETKTCQPGQFITSLESLKELCARDVSIQNIRTALIKLEKWQFLTNESTKTGRLITIMNWSSYQSDQPGYQQSNQQRTNKDLTTIKKGEKGKKKSTEYSAEFERFWKAYPNKKGKLKAYEAWKKLKSQLPPVDKLVDIVEKHKNSRDWQKDGGKYIPHPATWLNQGRWEDEIDPLKQMPRLEDDIVT